MRRETRGPLARPARFGRAARPSNSPPPVGRAGLRRLVMLALWLASFAGLAYGLHRLEPYARGAYGSTPWRLQWVKVPDSVPDWVLAEVERDQLTDALRRRPAHDPELCRDLAAALGRSPWIAAVRRVAVQADGLVNVRADVRTYLTYVVSDKMGYLVDRAGVRLPREEPRSRLDQYGMILLEGVKAGPPPPGQPWPGEDVAAGLKLVAYLEERCPRGGLRESLKAVDVANYNGRLNRREGWLRLRTLHPGRLIHWGKPPGEEYDIEARADRKLEHLTALYARHGQIPDYNFVDVRDPKEIWYDSRR